MNALQRFYRDESGATAIEYALIAALLSIVIIGGVTFAGESLQSLYGSIASKIAAAVISIG